MGDTVFIEGRAAVHKTSAGKSIAFPDVCLCPPSPPAGPVPTPLPNTVQAADLAGGAPTVVTEGNPTGKRSSFFKTSSGNEVARTTGGGVVSHVVQGQARFRSFSSRVFIEGEPAVRHLDLLTHNHVAQTPNTPPVPWMSTMDPTLPIPTPGGIAMSSARPEGTESIWISFVDELADHVVTEFRLRTPKGQSVEGRLPWGGHLIVSQLAKGRCQLTLPDVDDRCHRIGRRTGPKAASGEQPYQPGTQLVLATGSAHRIVVPSFTTLWLEIPSISDGDTAREHRFRLRSDDGQYDVLVAGQVTLDSDDHSLRLRFPDVFPGPRYTLTHETGSRSVPILSRLPFEDLFASADPASAPRAVRQPTPPGAGNR